MEKKLDFLENNRQAITNPYEGITDLSSMATDRSGQMSNAFSNLSVATKAAEMQIEEADIALANTLDTLMALKKNTQCNEIITPQKNNFKNKDIEIFNFLFKKGAKISKHIDAINILYHTN